MLYFRSLHMLQNRPHRNINSGAIEASSCGCLWDFSDSESLLDCRPLSEHLGVPFFISIQSGCHLDGLWL